MGTASDAMGVIVGRRDCKYLLRVKNSAASSSSHGEEQPHKTYNRQEHRARTRVQ